MLTQEQRICLTKKHSHLKKIKICLHPFVSIEKSEKNVKHLSGIATRNDEKLENLTWLKRMMMYLKYKPLRALSLLKLLRYLPIPLLSFRSYVLKLFYK